MFSEVIKLTPQVDRSALNQMFETLNQRFASVTKRFGMGLKNVLRFAPWAIAAGAIAKILNPLEKTEEILNRILEKGGAAKNSAEELDTSPGKLLRLQALGEAKGVDAETMRNLLGRFQAALAAEQEKANAPDRIANQLVQEKDADKRRELQGQLKEAQAQRDQGGLLRNFVAKPGETNDTAERFFEFLQSLQTIDKSQRVVVQKEIFGERARGKTAQLFNASPKELESILKQLPSADALEKAVKRTDDVASVKELTDAVRGAEDFVKKSSLVDESQIQAIDQSERLRLKGEDEALTRYDALKNTSVAVQELTNKFDSFATTVANTVLPNLLVGINGISSILGSILNNMNNYWAELKSSRIFKYFGGG